MTPTAYLNGRFLPLAEARISILDRGFTLGDGLFETLRAYKGKIFQLERHLDRLYASAGNMRLEVPEPRGRMAEVLNELLVRNELADAVLRLTLTRGEGPPGLAIGPEQKPTLAVTARPFVAVPAENYLKGVGISLHPDTAAFSGDASGQIKSTNYLARILLHHQARESGAFEAVLLDAQGRVTDGTTTNLFLVREGLLLTPSLGPFVLDGVTRRVVLERAREQDIPCNEQDLYPRDLLAAEEIFLTNTGIELLPVTAVNSQPAGGGRPGPVTGRLSAAFRKFVAAGGGQ